jgi:hypothetical protein
MALRLFPLLLLAGCSGAAPSGRQSRVLAEWRSTIQEYTLDPKVEEVVVYDDG